VNPAEKEPGTANPTLRMVFDTNIVIFSLLFAGGRLAWLRAHWRDGGCVPLIARETGTELTRVLAYPKFRLSAQDQLELLSDYLPFCESIRTVQRCPAICRDAKDQQFLDLAQSGQADLLVTGDADLLQMTGETNFAIISPEAYRQRVLLC